MPGNSVKCFLLEKPAIMPTIPTISRFVVANPKEIGRRVRELRKAKKMTQDDLAAEIGISRSSIAGVESGIDRAGLMTTIAIADYFKVPLDWLVGRVCPPGGPLVTDVIDDPDELAWLKFWRAQDDRRRAAILEVLQLPAAKAKRA